MIKHHVISPCRYHLGDIINIIQQCCALKSCYIASGHTCSCCGNCVDDCIRQILLLLESNVKLIESSTGIKIGPTWSNTPHITKTTNYKKSFIVPEKQTYITCQFDARSNKLKVIDKSEIDMLKNSGLELIDVGDASNLSIIKKFHLINNSLAYIGIDSGTSHLALMTNTPIYIVHRSHINPVAIYPPTSQIQFNIHMKDVINCLQT